MPPPLTAQCCHETDASYDGLNAIQSDKIIFPLHVMKLMRVTEVLNLWCCAQFLNFTCNDFFLVILSVIFQLLHNSSSASHNHQAIYINTHNTSNHNFVILMKDKYGETKDLSLWLLLCFHYNLEICQMCPVYKFFVMFMCSNMLILSIFSTWKYSNKTDHFLSPGNQSFLLASHIVPLSIPSIFFSLF